MNVSRETPPDTRYVLKKRASALEKYRKLAPGEVGFFRFLYYEIVVTLFTNIPGALGYFLRRVFFPPLFKTCGKGVVFGRGMTIRNPRNIEIGNEVVFDENVLLDGKGGRLRIGDRCIIARNTTLSCKYGDIFLNEEVNLSNNVTVYSNHRVEIGPKTFVAGHCYIVAGGEHYFEDTTKPIVEQGIKKGKGVKIGGDCWLGASVVVLDGTRLGYGCVVGAGSLLRGEYEDFSIIVGSPGKTIRKRGEKWKKD